MITYANFSLWLKVWIAAVVVLLAPLVLIGLASEYRELRRSAVPRPLFVIYQKTLARLLARGTSRNDSLLGRTVLLDWDLRFVAAGTTLGKITGFDPSSRQIMVELSTPLPFAPPFPRKTSNESLKDVIFCPASKKKARYGKCQVFGTLRPAIMGGYVYAEIVVYPAHGAASSVATYLLLEGGWE